MKRTSFLIPVLATCAILPACAPVIVAGGAATGVAVAQERTVGSAIDDVTINTRILNNFTKHEGLVSNVGAEVQEGRVLLTGKVASSQDKEAAERLAWEAEGVREIINEIQVSDNPNSLGRFTSDTTITSVAKGRLLAEKNVKSVNYSLETVDGVVYVIGLAQNEDELERVLNIISRVRGVKQVVSHVRLKTDPRRTQQQ